MQPFEQFEQDWGRLTGPDRHCVVCSSGTAALHLALEALRLPPGSGVIVPDYTMAACPRAVVMAGLVPVFVDCTPDRLIMDHDLIPEALARFPGIVRAVMPVHVYGRECGRAHTTRAVKDTGLEVIEDCAEAHGLPQRGVDGGVAAQCWSFYSNKIVGGEEGGAVLFRDLTHASWARMLRTLGFTPDHDYSHVPRGHNYRLANLLATPILRSLSRMTISLERRRELVRAYDAAIPAEWHQPGREVPWVYDVRIPGLTKTRQYFLIHALRERGIPARFGFKPMSSLPEFRGCVAVRHDGEDEAGRASREVLYLPLDPRTVDEGVVERAAQILRAAYAAGED